MPASTRSTARQALQDANKVSVQMLVDPESSPCGQMVCKETVSQRVKRCYEDIEGDAEPSKRRRLALSAVNCRVETAGTMVASIPELVDLIIDQLRDIFLDLDSDEGDLQLQRELAAASLTSRTWARCTQRRLYGEISHLPNALTSVARTLRSRPDLASRVTGLTQIAAAGQTPHTFCTPFYESILSCTPGLTSIELGGGGRTDDFHLYPLPPTLEVVLLRGVADRDLRAIAALPKLRELGLFDYLGATVGEAVWEDATFSVTSPVETLVVTIETVAEGADARSAVAGIRWLVKQVAASLTSLSLRRFDGEMALAVVEEAPAGLTDFFLERDDRWPWRSPLQAEVPDTHLIDMIERLCAVQLESFGYKFAEGSSVEPPLVVFHDYIASLPHLRILIFTWLPTLDAFAQQMATYVQSQIIRRSPRIRRDRAAPAS